MEEMRSISSRMLRHFSTSDGARPVTAPAAGSGSVVRSVSLGSGTRVVPAPATCVGAGRVGEREA